MEGLNTRKTRVLRVSRGSKNRKMSPRTLVKYDTFFFVILLIFRAFGASWGAPGALLATPAASWWRPGASPNRPVAPRRLQDRFFNDFGSIFRRFLLDFPSIGLQCSFRFVLLMRWPGRSFWRRLRQRRPCNGPAIEHEKRETTRSNSAHARAHAKASRSAFVLRFAGRACLHNLHAPPHSLRHSALHGAPR